MPGTFNFSQTSAPSVEEARAVPFYGESRELMQNTGNEEHTERSGLPCPSESDVQMSNPRHSANCLEIRAGGNPNRPSKFGVAHAFGV